MSIRKSVLIVTSSYAPAMTADMHRARHLAWELPAFGWDVEILAPGRWYQASNLLDADSDGFFCKSTVVHYAPAPGPILRRVIRSSTIGWRALLPLDREAKRVLGGRRFDLIYFSTTQFNLFLLGPRWQRRYGIPYVVDIHDPIYRPRTTGQGPGRTGLKALVNRFLLGRIESGSMRGARGIVSVSSAYLDTFAKRYGDSLQSRRPGRQATIPFAGSERDLAEAQSNLPPRNCPADGPARIVYVGAGGYVMARAFRVLCQLLRHAIDRGECDPSALRIELYGTLSSWREGDPRELCLIAEEEGVASCVVEEPQRISFRRSLELLLGADGALILGVDDEGYMPSKLYTYALAGKPLLAVVQDGSEAHRALAAAPGLANVIAFDAAQLTLEGNGSAMRGFLLQTRARESIDRKGVVAGNLASAMAHRHAELFDACLQPD